MRQSKIEAMLKELDINEYDVMFIADDIKKLLRANNIKIDTVHRIRRLPYVDNSLEIYYHTVENQGAVKVYQDNILYMQIEEFYK